MRAIEGRETSCPHNWAPLIFTEQQVSPSCRISDAAVTLGAGGERGFATPTAAMLFCQPRVTREGRVVTVKESPEKLVATTGYAV